ncbi:hypothetical protein [Streptomyces peucetius]|uniref:Uncharacterized protein n=1 Tax=Streptomyces peucetius TaxID=1950 RepID=A0ABY6ID79_STRPE|nr:hypothetical protein [Streptomyces peucetius]UYQ63812.1 hypothetical protein OGH68_21710 [Streptomyces peucetius]
MSPRPSSPAAGLDPAGSWRPPPGVSTTVFVRTVVTHLVCFVLALAVLAAAAGGTAAAPVLFCALLLGSGVALSLRLRRLRERASTPRRPRTVAATPGHALPPAPPLSGHRAAEQAVTRYGELLARRPLDGGVHAADWQIALDVYEEAKRAEPGLVPQILARGHGALKRLSAGDGDDRERENDPALWSRGSGSATVRMPRPEGWTGKCLLAFEGSSPSGFLVCARVGRRGRRAVKLASREHGPALVRVPAPAAPVEGAVTIEISTDGPWRAALLPARQARALDGTVHGDASEVLLNRAGHRLATFEHRGDGDFAIREPHAHDPRAGRLIAEGEGRSSLRLGLHGIGAVFVDSDDAWSVTVSGT